MDTEVHSDRNADHEIRPGTAGIVGTFRSDIPRAGEVDIWKSLGAEQAAAGCVDAFPLGVVSIGGRGGACPGKQGSRLPTATYKRVATEVGKERFRARDWGFGDSDGLVVARPSLR